MERLLAQRLAAYWLSRGNPCSLSFQRNILQLTVRRSTEWSETRAPLDVVAFKKQILMSLLRINLLFSLFIPT